MTQAFRGRSEWGKEGARRLISHKAGPDLGQTTVVYPCGGHCTKAPSYTAYLYFYLRQPVCKPFDFCNRCDGLGIHGTFISEIEAAHDAALRSRQEVCTTTIATKYTETGLIRLPVQPAHEQAMCTPPRARPGTRPCLVSCE